MSSFNVYMYVATDMQAKNVILKKKLYCPWAHANVLSSIHATTQQKPKRNFDMAYAIPKQIINIRELLSMDW